MSSKKNPKQNSINKNKSTKQQPTSAKHQIQSSKHQATSSKRKESQSKPLLEKLSASYLPYIIIVLLSFIVYAQTIGFGFTGMDDKTIIQDNSELLSSINNIGEMFTRDAFLSKDGQEFYRPLQSLTYLFDAQIGGTAPWIYHFSNVIIHCLTCCGIFYLFTLFHNKKEIAFLAALIYSIHPLFAHTVAWAPSRGDLLIALFGVWSFVFFIKFLKSKNIIFFLLHSFLFLLAVFSKENAILFPVMYLFYFQFISKGNHNKSMYLLLIPAYTAIDAAFLAARASVVKIQLIEEVFGVKALLNNLATLPEIVFKFFIPAHLSTMPAFNTYVTLGGIAIIILITAVIIFTKEKRWLYIIFGLLWIFVFTVPGMFYRHQIAEWSFDYFQHRSYLPMVGMLIIIAEILRKHIIAKNYNKIFTAGCVISCFLIIVNVVHSRDFNDAETFFNNAIKTNPKNAMAYNNLGLLYYEAGKKELAIDYMKNSIKQKPDLIPALNNLGKFYTEMGNNQLAINYLNKSIKIKASNASAYFYRGKALANMGNDGAALSDYNTAINTKPDFAEAWNNIGLIYAKQGHFQQAVEYFTKAIYYKIPSYEVYANRGNCRHLLMDFKGACSDWQTAAEHGSRNGMEMLQRFCK